MKISRLRLKNFRCYFGEQGPLDLSTSDTANVILVFGENMRGKTSLLQAIRWGLYGVARDRQGREIPVVDPATKEQLLSRDAESAGNYSMMVSIDFEHDGREYTLTREVASRVLEPRSDADLLVHKHLQSGTQVFSEAAVDAYIQNILSEDVSRFFLFDAEMLEVYEDLLKNPEEEALAVQQAIEKILGVPALRVFEKLADEAREADKRQNAHLRKRDKHTALVEQVAAIDNVVVSLRRDISELGTLREKAQTEASEAELECKRNADLELRIKETSELERQIDIQKDKLTEEFEALAGILRRAWWLPLVPHVQQRLARLREEGAEAAESLRQLHRIELLDQSTTEKSCALCSADLHQQSVISMREEASRLKLENFGRDLGSLLEATRRADTYEQFSSAEDIGELRVRQENVAEVTTAISALETRVAELRATMENRSYGDYNIKYDRWQRLLKQVADLEDGIQSRRDLLKTNEAERGKLQDSLNRLPDADPTLALETQLYEELSGLFEDAMAEFREGLRASVGEDASRIFKSLTTESAYQGLEIDKNYGLVLLDRDGSAVPGRSAGAEQIVALSLIGGLNRAAVREGPVVMDSNFARLDTGHRENVLRFLPQLGGQVMVLVHSGEITRKQDLAQFGVHVARRLEIRRVTETRSEIVSEVSR